MKVYLLSAVFFLSSINVLAHDQDRSEYDCGLLSGMVVATESLASVDAVRALGVKAWVTIYEINRSKAVVVKKGIDRNLKVLTMDHARTGLKFIGDSIQSVIDTPTRYGDVKYWVSMVDGQVSSFSAIKKSMKDLKSQLCD